MISRPVVCKPHVGRSRELDYLVDRRILAGDGHGGLVVVAGEAGVGKSRLIAEFMLPIVHGAARIARVECREFAQDPFGPLDELLDTLDPLWRPARPFETAGERLDAIVRAFDRSCARRTTVAVIEDIHWADPHLIATLRILAARAASRRLLFVASVRDTEIQPSSPTFVTFGRLLRERAVGLVSLAPLDSAATLTLLQHALDGHPALPHFALEEIAERSDGNPLFAEELVRHAIDRRAAGTVNSDGVPLTLQAVVRERLASCTPGDREFLSAASLFGRTFDLTVLDRILALQRPYVGRELHELRALQLVVPIDGKPHEFAFRHALVRDVLYADLPAADAKPIHERIARALASRADSADYVADIAYHYWQSGQQVAGASAFLDAARAARATLAYAQAVRWYERAADAATVVAAADTIRLELARTYAAADQSPAALALYEELVRNAERRGDIAFVVRARKLMAGLLSNDGRRDEAVALLENTLEHVDPEDDETRSELLVRITTIQAMRQQTGEARRTLALLDPARMHGRSPLMAEFLLLRAQLNAREGLAQAWRHDFERAVTIFRELPDAEPFVRFSHVVFAWQAWARGLLHLARAHLELANAASAQSAAANSDVPLLIALTELHLGHFELACTWLEGVSGSGPLMARKLRAQIGVEIGAALGRSDMIESYLDLDLVAEAARKDDAYGVVRMSCSFGVGLATLGRRTEADAYFERAARTLESTYEFTPAILTLVAERPDLRRSLRTVFVESEKSLDPAFARAALYLIDVESAELVTAQTQSDAREAVRLFDELGWAVLAARAAEHVHLHDALERYRRIGHVTAIRRLTHVEPTAAPYAGVLSGRERAVIALVAKGATNRETALALAISEKTIEKHLSSVYRKLNYNSRSQLTAFVLGSQIRD